MFSSRLLVTALASIGFAGAAIACPMHKSHDQNAQSPMPAEQQTATQTKAEPEAKPAEQKAAETAPVVKSDEPQVASNPAPTVK